MGLTINSSSRQNNSKKSIITRNTNVYRFCLLVGLCKSFLRSPWKIYYLDSFIIESSIDFAKFWSFMENTRKRIYDGSTIIKFSTTGFPSNPPEHYNLLLSKENIRIEQTQNPGAIIFHSKEQRHEIKVAWNHFLKLKRIGFLEFYSL